MKNNCVSLVFLVIYDTAEKQAEPTQSLGQAFLLLDLAHHEMKTSS